MNVFITLRGFLDKPTIVKINLATFSIISMYKFDLPFPTVVAPDKKGFSGIINLNGIIYCTTWHQIVLIKEKSMEIIKVINSIHFSDLHGINIWNDNIYVASTTQDTILEVNQSNNKVKIIYSSWVNDKKLQRKYSSISSFIDKNRHELPFSKLHINGIGFNEKYAYISTLGIDVKYKISAKNVILKLKETFGFYYNKENIETLFKRFGSIIILDCNDNFKKIYSIKEEGFHDPFIDGIDFIFPQYFTNTLLKLDTEKSEYKIISLDIPKEYRRKLLCRGGITFDDNYIIGHSVHRKFKNEFDHGFVREYSKSGKFTGRELIIPFGLGIYHFCEASEK